MVMQGFERLGGALLDGAVGHLVPAGSMFAFLAAHRAEVFPDADYADLFAPAGAWPATQMAAVLALQALHDYCDPRRVPPCRLFVCSYLGRFWCCGRACRLVRCAALFWPGPGLTCRGVCPGQCGSARELCAGRRPVPLVRHS